MEETLDPVHLDTTHLDPTHLDKIKMSALKTTHSYWDFANQTIVANSPDTMEELELLIESALLKEEKISLYTKLKEVAEDKWNYVNFLALGSKPWLTDMKSIEVQKAIDTSLYLAAKQKLAVTPTDAYSLSFVEEFEARVLYLSDSTKLIEEIKKLVGAKIEAGQLASAKAILIASAEVTLSVGEVTTETIEAIKAQLLEL